MAFGRLRANAWERNGIKLDTKLKVYQMARQDVRHTGPEEGRDASMLTVLKLAQLRWTGHVILMPDEELPKKIFNGELQGETLPRCPENTLQKYLQSLTEELQETNRFLGTGCIGPIKVTQSHQQKSSSL